MDIAAQRKGHGNRKASLVSPAYSKVTCSIARVLYFLATPIVLMMSGPGKSHLCLSCTSVYIARTSGQSGTTTLTPDALAAPLLTDWLDFDVRVHCLND